MTDRPELMAIGDSMFQGVRSLSINEERAGHAPVAQFAKAAKLHFVRPIYPWPVLFDLEDFARNTISSLIHLKSAILANSAKWMSGKGRPLPPPSHDNLAFGGADYADLGDRTAAKARMTAENALRAIKAHDRLPLGEVYNLWRGINEAFVLNPANDSKLENLSALGQVALRRPKRLMINIGSNEGLFRFGMLGDYDQLDLDFERSPVRKRLLDGADMLGRFIKENLDGADTIVYFNSLVRPRAIPNLAPYDDRDMHAGPSKQGGYFDEYSTKVVLRRQVTQLAMKKYDELIKRTNDDIVQTLSDHLTGTSIQVVAVDIYRELEKHDGKHWGNSRKITVKRRNGTSIRLSNQPFASLGGFKHGGICGLDNMHPSAVGYALMANCMLEAYAQNEDKPNTAGIDPAALYSKDALLKRPPKRWEALNSLVSALATGFFAER